MSESNLIYLVYFLAGLSAFLFVAILRIEIRLRKMLRGNKVENFESAVTGAFRDIEKLYEAKDKINNEIEEVKKRARKNLKTTGTVKFNPFGDSGVRQSFATAFIDENGDGVVLSSIYARERMNVYAKPLQNGKSECELSPEEQEAIKRAKTR